MKIFINFINTVKSLLFPKIDNDLGLKEVIIPPVIKNEVIENIEVKISGGDIVLNKSIITQEEAKEIITAKEVVSPDKLFLEKLHKTFEKKLPKSVINQLPQVIDKFKINTPYRLSHFLGQCSHESNNFKTLFENLNYSVSGLSKFVNWRRISLVESTKYGRTKDQKANQEMIANIIYGGPWGVNNLGNTVFGEGWKFRGTGYLQTTGKYNFKKLSDFVKIDFVKNPELLASDYPLFAGAFFFVDKSILPICDSGIDSDNIMRVTKKINVGALGIKHRESETVVFYNLIIKNEIF
jgi:putative chitinase